MLCQVHCLDTFGFLFRSSGLKAGGGEKKTGEIRSGGRCAIYSIMCCAILFPAGPEAVQRQPSEDMKDLEFPDVLEFIQNQVRDAPEYS